MTLNFRSTKILNGFIRISVPILQSVQANRCEILCSKFALWSRVGVWDLRRFVRVGAGSTTHKEVQLARFAYLTLSPRFERIWLESKKRLPEYVSQKPANLGLRSQYSIRLCSWAKKYVEAGTKSISLEELRKGI